MDARVILKTAGTALVGVLLTACAASPEVPGATSRTLAAGEVEALRLGRGMGMAAVAEINGYPGPRHVLDLKEKLGLTPDQRFATSRLVGLVQGQSRGIGERIIQAERQLDEDMAAGRLSSEQVRGRLQGIAALRAQLRFTHVNAHMEQKRILTPEQVQRYYELRGRDVELTAPKAPPPPAEPLRLAPEAAASPEPDPATSPQPAADPLPAPEPPPAESPAAPSTEMIEPAPAMAPETPPGTETATEPEAAPPLPSTGEAASPSAPEEAPASGELTPGMRDALEDAEPVESEPPVIEKAPPPAGELVPLEEPGAPDAGRPRALGPDVDHTAAAKPAPDDDAPAAAAPQAGEPDEALSPGVQDAMELAEPLPAADTPPEEQAIHIAPLEDEELETLEPVDVPEPATIDLDN